MDYAGVIMNEARLKAWHGLDPVSIMFDKILYLFIYIQVLLLYFLAFKFICITFSQPTNKAQASVHGYCFLI